VAPHLLVELERRPDQLGHDLLADVVAGGAQSAGGDHGAGARQRALDRLADGVRAVAHAGPAHHLHADGRERPRDLRAVGVQREAEQELGADGDEF
jgi:hypothetical protein